MRSQELPVRMIVIAGLGILTLIVGAAMFVIGMRGTQQETRFFNATQAECNNICGSISVAANNYNDCQLLKQIPSSLDYIERCVNFGPCVVSLGNGVQCSVS